MQLSFNRSDSFYKIFKTFEKIPDNKKLLIHIHPENQFYNNTRRWEQLMQLLEGKNISFEFISNTNNTKEYLEQLWAKIHKEEDSFDYKKSLNMIYMFLFKIKDFHLYVVNKKNISRYLVIWLEILAMLLLVYWLYAVTIPTANIYIIPSYNSEEIMYNFRYFDSQMTWWYENERTISIPYYEWNLDYSYTMNSTVKNIRYLQNPSRWQVKIYNTTSKLFAMKPSTKFITEDGMIYKSTSRVEVKAWSIQKPSEVVIDIEALETDIKWNIIWQRWNIPSWTKLLIKNLRDSFITKQVYAESFNNFTWWQTNSQWSITDQDISSFSGKVIDYIAENKKEILIKELRNNDIKPMLFDETIWVIPKWLKTTQKVWSDSPTIEWTVSFDIKYKYIKRSDIQAAINKYLTQRPSDSVSLVDIDKTSVTFFEKTEVSSWVYIIPTKINTVWWYNFESDVSNIKNTIIEKIIWKDQKSAKDVILNYPDVADVNIQLSPFRIQNIPNFKSNIKIYNGKQQ